MYCGTCIVGVRIGSLSVIPPLIYNEGVDGDTQIKKDDGWERVDKVVEVGNGVGLGGTSMTIFGSIVVSGR